MLDIWTARVDLPDAPRPTMTTRRILVSMTEDQGSCARQVLQIGIRRLRCCLSGRVPHGLLMKRSLVPVPVLTPRLSTYWVHWITPIPSRVSAPLIDGLRNVVVVRENLARKLFPRIRPQGYDAAIEKVIEDLDHGRSGAVLRRGRRRWRCSGTTSGRRASRAIRASLAARPWWATTRRRWSA